MTRLGYTALYLDNDVAVVADPITAAYVGSPYDIQVCILICNHARPT
jgi:hypothetical protein